VQPESSLTPPRRAWCAVRRLVLLVTEAPLPAPAEKLRKANEVRTTPPYSRRRASRTFAWFRLLQKKCRLAPSVIRLKKQHVDVAPQAPKRVSSRCESRARPHRPGGSDRSRCFSRFRIIFAFGRTRFRIIFAFGRTRFRIIFACGRSRQDCSQVGRGSIVCIRQGFWFRLLICLIQFIWLKWPGLAAFFEDSGRCCQSPRRYGRKRLAVTAALSDLKQSELVVECAVGDKSCLALGGKLAIDKAKAIEKETAEVEKAKKEFEDQKGVLIALIDTRVKMEGGLEGAINAALDKSKQDKAKAVKLKKAASRALTLAMQAKEREEAAAALAAQQAAEAKAAMEEAEKEARILLGDNAALSADDKLRGNFRSRGPLNSKRQHLQQKPAHAAVRMLPSRRQISSCLCTVSI